MANNSAVKGSARDRLLTAANELFYEEGVQSVGIDRVIERAGVAKASLYNTFGSKDELVRAYLRSRHDRSTARITRHIQRYDTPRERLLAVFEAQAELFAEPTFHGCPFVQASAEAKPGSSIEHVSDDYRSWIRGTFTELAVQAGVGQPEALARKLHMLYDGATLSARMDRDADAANAAARETANDLLDVALAKSRTA